jgi:hypothetical protein
MIHQPKVSIMDIYHAINSVMQNPPGNEQAAASLLAQYPADVQEQLIAAVYLGRDHLHSSQMRPDTDWTRAATDHIKASDYPRILAEKDSAVQTYLSRLLQCASASNYDLKTM